MHFPLVKIVKNKVASQKAAICLSIRLDGQIRMLALLAASLLIIHILLTTVHYTLSELPWLVRSLFDVDEEESVPTWLSSVLLLLTSLALSFIYRVKRDQGDTYQVAWLGLAIGFVAMSVDEIAGFHEAINSVTEFSWAILGLIVAAVVFAAYVRFLASLPASTAVGFIVAGAVYVGGAVGVELATEPYLYNDELDTLGYNLWTAVEEAMEMGGVLYFLSTLKRYVFEFISPVVSIEIRRR
jgi:hypothetical protein